MPAERTILFVCPHGAAKSVMAAAYCQRLGTERALPVRATSAGTEPEAEIPSRVVEGLGADGIDVRGRRPRAVTREEIGAAWRVVSLGAELGVLAAPGVRIDHWDDIPPVSADFGAARAALLARLPALLDELTGLPV